MNNFFAAVGSSLATKIKVDNTNYLNGLDEKDSDSLLISWKPTSVAEISNIIDGIDLSKNSQIKDIDTSLFKDCLTCTKDQICILFNRIL